jgi:hypothetical protein
VFDLILVEFELGNRERRVEYVDVWAGFWGVGVMTEFGIST